MPIRTRVNGEWIREIAYFPLRMTLPELGKRAGFAQNYIYHLCNPNGTRKPNLDTIDRLANAIEERYRELRMMPPDDIWRRLTIQERKE